MDEIETSRLSLRHLTPRDLDEVASILSDPLVVKYLVPGHPATREESEVALLSMIRHWQRYGYGRWAIVHRATRHLVGYGGLRCFNGEPELVYLIARPYWNRGFATEIARACLDYGFMQHDFERIIAITHYDNLASRRVLDKVGLRYERDDSFYGIEVACYAMTRADYRFHSLSASASASLDRLPPAAHE